MHAHLVNSPRRHFFFAAQSLAALVFVALTVFFSVREEYWADEGFTVRRVEASWAQIYNPFAVKPAPNADPFDARYVYDFNPPLYFALVRAVAGPHPGKLGLRLFSIAPALGILILLGWMVHRRYGLAAASAALGALAFSPALVYYGHEARPYALAAFFAAMLILVYDRLPTRAWIVFALNATAAMLGTLTHYHTLWLVMALGALYLFDAAINAALRRNSIAAICGLIAGAAATALIMLPLRHTISATVSQASPHLTGMLLLKMLFFPIMTTNGSTRPQLLLSLIAIALFLVTILLSRARMTVIGRWLWLWLAASIAPIAAHVIFGQLYHERYAIFALPAWAMLLGAVVRAAWAQSRLSRIAATLLIAAILANGVYWTARHINQPFRPPWRFAIEAMYAREQPGDFYTVQPQWLTLGFVANAGAPPTSRYVSDLKRIPPEAKRLWVLEQANRERRAATLLSAAGWNVEPVLPAGVYWLWLAEKK